MAYVMQVQWMEEKERRKFDVELPLAPNTPRRVTAIHELFALANKRTAA